jgi:hypothetical protein
MTATEKRPRKKLPPDARAIAALALLLEGTDEGQFDQALAALVDNMKPRIRQAWSERRQKKEVYDPLTAAVQTGNVRTVIEAIYTNEAAMSLLTQLHAEHLAKPAAA